MEIPQTCTHKHTHTHKQAHTFISVLLNNSLMLSIFHVRDYYSLPTIPSSWLSCVLTGHSYAISLAQQSAVCTRVHEENKLNSAFVCVCKTVRDRKAKIYSAFTFVQVKQRKRIIFFCCVSVCMWAKGSAKRPCVCVSIRVAHLCAVVLNQAGVCGWYLQLQQCWSPQRGTSPWGRDSSKLISTHTFMHTHTKGASWGGCGKKKEKWEQKKA